MSICLTLLLAAKFLRHMMGSNFIDDTSLLFLDKFKHYFKSGGLSSLSYTNRYILYLQQGLMSVYSTISNTWMVRHSAIHINIVIIQIQSTIYRLSDCNRLDNKTISTRKTCPKQILFSFFPLVCQQICLDIFMKECTYPHLCLPTKVNQ